MNEYVGARASRPHRGWHERGYLPHFDGGAIVQTIPVYYIESNPVKAKLVAKADDWLFSSTVTQA